MRSLLRLYVGVALAGGTWAFAIAWTSRDRDCLIDDCRWPIFLWWTGLAVILLATVALLARVDRTRFPAKPLALICTLLVGSVLLALALVIAGVDEEIELLLDTIAVATLLVIAIPLVFILASLGWILFRPKHESTEAGAPEQ